MIDPWQARGANGSTSTFTISGEDVLVPQPWHNNQTFVIEKIYHSTPSSDPILLIFHNETDEAVNVYWHDYSGDLQAYSTIQPNQYAWQNTYATHPWSATCGSGVQLLTGDERVFVPTANDDQATIIIRKQEAPIDYCADNNDDPEHTVSGETQTTVIDGDWFPEDFESSFMHLVGMEYRCNELTWDRRNPGWKRT